MLPAVDPILELVLAYTVVREDNKYSFARLTDYSFDDTSLHKKQEARHSTLKFNSVFSTETTFTAWDVFLPGTGCGLVWWYIPVSKPSCFRHFRSQQGVLIIRSIANLEVRARYTGASSLLTVSSALLQSFLFSSTWIILCSRIMIILFLWISWPQVLTHENVCNSMTTGLRVSKILSTGTSFQPWLEKDWYMHHPFWFLHNLPHCSVQASIVQYHGLVPSIC